MKVLSVHIENDGTALKPALQFDPTQKSLVGLGICLEFINEHQDKSPELMRYLKENVGIEASVT